MNRLLNVSAGLLALLTPACSFATTLSFIDLGKAVPTAGIFSPLDVSSDLAPGGALVGDFVTGLLGTPVWSSLESGEESLTLTFAQPTSQFGFEVLVESTKPIGTSRGAAVGCPVYVVTLSSGAVFNEAVTPCSWYSESQYVYQGAPIDSATVSYMQAQNACRCTIQSFALSNLARTNSTITTAPEPGTMCMAGLGFMTLAFSIGRSRRGRRRRNLPITGQIERHKVRLVRQD